MAGNVFELGHLTRDDVARIAPDALLALPVGSIEQHGPDLPLLTDSMLVDTVTYLGRTRS